MRCKAVLKHTQSKRWREVWCGPASAKRLDCVRFIAALSRPFLTRSAAKTLHDCPPASEFGISGLWLRVAIASRAARDDATGFHSLQGGNSRLGDAILLQIGDVEND